MKFRQKKTQHRSMDLTPLIDVVFLILIFFVVSSILNIEQSINVKLPVAESSTKSALTAPPVVTLTKEGGFFLNGEPVAAAELAASLRKLQSQKSGQVLLIRSDGEVKHKNVVFTMDAGRSAGYVKLSIVTVPK